MLRRDRKNGKPSKSQRRDWMMIIEYINRERRRRVRTVCSSTSSER